MSKERRFALIDIDKINLDDSPIARVATDDDTVEKYAARYRAKKEMPAIALFGDKDADRYILGDGMHRILAASQAGLKSIMAEIFIGGWDEAFIYAMSSNTTHGLPRTNSDKRFCIKSSLIKFGTMTNAAIAEMCDVDDHTVATVRSEMEAEGQIKKTETRMTKKGKEVPAGRQPKKNKEPEKDKNGTVIPQGVLKYWQRGEEPKLMIEVITDIMKQVKSAMDNKDVMYAEVNFTGVLADLEKARKSIGVAIPHAVCTQCQGHPETQRGGCRLCLGRGLISKFRWDVVPEEVRNMVKAGNHVE